MPGITISAIAAMASNRVIGGDNKMLWHIPEDFKYFKKTTLGKPVIMGRKTYESLGKPLPGRANIVISRTPAKTEGIISVTTIDEAITEAKAIATRDKQNEIFIIGGGEIYKKSLPQTDRLYLTIIDRDYEGDTRFPDFNRDEWKTISEDRHEGDPAYTFLVLERK